MYIFENFDRISRKYSAQQRQASVTIQHFRVLRDKELTMDMSNVFIDHEEPKDITSDACTGYEKAQGLKGSGSRDGKKTLEAPNSDSGTVEGPTEEICDEADDKKMLEDVTQKSEMCRMIYKQQQEYEMLLQKKERLDKIFLAFDDNFRKRREEKIEEDDVTPSVLMKSSNEDKKAVSKVKRIRNLCDSISDSVNVISDAAGGRVVERSKRRAREREARHPPPKHCVRAEESTDTKLPSPTFVRRVFGKLRKSLRLVCCVR